MATQHRLPSTAPDDLSFLLGKSVAEPIPKPINPPHLLTVTISTSPPETHPAPPLKTEQQMGSEEASTNPNTLVSTTGDEGSKNRDDLLAKVNQDRTYSHIRAWEENVKAKSLNKLNRVVAKINSWENTKKAMAESRLKRAEEKLEKKRAAYLERMKNQVAEVHRQAEEMRAVAEAKRGEEMVHAEEMGVKYRAAGYIPRRFLCFEA